MKQLQPRVVPVGMGAGINSGLGYLGEMGPNRTLSFQYDVLGDSVSRPTLK